jgi:1,4-alpha-glucan branching enzyme
MKTRHKSTKQKTTTGSRASSPNPQTQGPNPGSQDSPVTELPPELTTVTFKYMNPAASDVRLAGTFNNWDTTATPMRKRSEGQWETELQLPPGEYQYRYFVDGNWQDDPASSNTIPNPFGAHNSVIAVTGSRK